MVVDGQIWYEGNHRIQSDKMKTTKSFYLGTYDENSFSYGNFTGELAELNIWSNFLTVDVLKSMTNSCQIPKIIPDILNWSDIKISMLNNKNTDIKEIKNICFNSEDGGNIFHKVMPVRLIQEDAIQVCEILKAKMSYPLTTAEYQYWPSKLELFVSLL